MWRVRRAEVLVEEVFQGRETMGTGDVGVQEVTTMVIIIMLGGRGVGRDWIRSRKLLASFIYVGRDFINA